MAFKSGITGGQISKLERDAYEPRLATLYALADALGVGPCDLTPQSIDIALKVRSASLVTYDQMQMPTWSPRHVGGATTVEAEAMRPAQQPQLIPSDGAAGYQQGAAAISIERAAIDDGRLLPNTRTLSGPQVLLAAAQMEADNISEEALGCLKRYRDLLGPGVPDAFGPAMNKAARASLCNVADWWARGANMDAPSFASRAVMSAGDAVEEVLAQLRMKGVALDPGIEAFLRVVLTYEIMEKMCLISGWWARRSRVGPDDDV